jgi:F-type H+-transporting ATPase subunit epsilon
MDVHIVTPEREVFSGPATIVSARGTEGDVGIMPRHAPLLIRLAISVLTIRNENDSQVAVVDGGFLHVSTTDDHTRVDVLATHAELETEIDMEEAERVREEMERRVQENGTAEARGELMKALVRLSVKG